MRFKNADATIVSTAQDVAECAAQATEALARARIRANGRFSIALSGGSTPRLFHEVLVTRHRAAIDWSKVVVLFSDERAVPPSDPNSNYRMAEETLLSKVPIRALNVLRVEADDGDSLRAALEYDHAIERMLGPKPAIDLLVLGMGEDGHTASLFPGADASDGGRFVIATEAPPSSPVARRVTFSYDAIRRAHQVMALIAGAGKAERLREVLLEEGDLPMQRVLRERTGNTVLFVDHAAAARLAEAINRS